jgi:Flp pilus assembly pilin Flp
MFQRLWRDQVGASLIEYSILAALITVIVVVAMSVAGSWIQGMRALVAPAGLSPSVLLCSTGIHRAIVIAAQRGSCGSSAWQGVAELRDSRLLIAMSVVPLPGLPAQWNGVSRVEISG